MSALSDTQCFDVTPCLVACAGHHRGAARLAGVHYEDAGAVQPPTARQHDALLARHHRRSRAV